MKIHFPIIRLIFVMVLMMFHHSASAQDTDPFSYNANIRPSAQAWEMTKYGSLSPSLYTGTFQYSLPIYTYKDEDFEIPVSLSYSFNGYRPNQGSGPVGLGWTLNCGGVITRDVVGLPDDYNESNIKGFYYPVFTNIFPIAKAMLIDSSYAATNIICQTAATLSEDTPLSFFMGSTPLLSDRPMIYNDSGSIGYDGYFFDTASDIYHFALPGGNSGSFVILPSGRIAVFGSTDPGSEYSVSIDYEDAINGGQKIAITTADGFIYLFGKDHTYRDISYDARWVFDNTPLGANLYCFSSLRLYKITAPNGRTVVFDQQAPRPYLDISFSDAVHFGYSKDYYTGNAPDDFFYTLGYSSSKKFLCTVSRLLQSISVDGHRIIRFDYSDKAAFEYGTNAFSESVTDCDNIYPHFEGNEGPLSERFNSANRLSAIVITDFAGNNIDSITCSQTYTSSSSHHSPKMFLNSVIGSFGTFGFTYNHSSPADCYPSIDCIATDHWGYWRGNFGELPFSSSNIAQQDASLYNIDSSNRDPDSTYTSYGAMRTISYPTGGITRIEYECNRVGKRINIDITDPSNTEYELQTCDNYLVGGLRVKKLINHCSSYGSFADSTEFDYGTNGILHIMPRYSMRLKTDFFQRATTYYPQLMAGVYFNEPKIGYVLMNSFGNIPSSGFSSDYHLGYSSVAVLNADGSKTMFSFYDYEQYPDVYAPDNYTKQLSRYYFKTFHTTRQLSSDWYELNYYTFGNASGSDLLRSVILAKTKLTDNSHIRGKIESVTDYDALSNKISEKQFKYSLAEVASRKYIANGYNHLIAVLNHFYQPQIDTVISIEFFSGEPLSTTVSYNYNSKGQKISERVSTYNSLVDRITRYRYWHEIDSTAPVANIADVVHLRPDLYYSEFVIGLEHYQYHPTIRYLPIRKSVYHIDIPYDNFFSSIFIPPEDMDSTYVTISYDPSNFWRTNAISFSHGGYSSFQWDTTGRYILSREDNGPANKTYYQWQDMVGLSHITYPTGQGEYYGYDSHNRLCSVDNTWQEPLARYDYHLVNGGDTLTGGTNFIRRTSYLRPAVSYKDISYYDGLGYPAQDVALDAGSAGHVVTPKWLDPMRREDARLYLPYSSTSSAFDLQSIATQTTWYQNRFESGEVFNYQENNYGTSPSGRKESSRLPGSSFRNHCDTLLYRVNTDQDSVLSLSYEYPSPPYINASIYVSAFCFPPGSLACTTTVDADGRITETFSDALGYRVLTRILGNGTKADTYYVRDLKDSLVCVIQPEGTNLLHRMMTLSLLPSTLSDVLDSYAFIYTYDARGRLTARKGPSLEAEEYTYDDRDRLVTSTDGNLRDNGWKIKYEYDIYDCLIRKSIINATTGATVAVLSEYAYDRTGYQCTGANAPPVLDALAFEVVDPGITGVYPPATTDRTGTSLGQKYYEKQLILEGGRYSYGNPKYVERAFYYDNLGRLLQSVESNAQGGITRESFNYDLVGNMVSRSISATAGSASMTKLTAFNLDSRGRVTAEHTYLNGATTPTASVIFTYDVLGRQNAINDGGLVQADHYALQGWVSHRLSELTAGGNTSSIFSEYLRRESAVYTTPSYTGRIAETFWMHGGQPSGTYVLNYDGFGRLRDGWHYLYGNPVNEWSERNITYDRNGNVLSLLRYGSSGTTPLNNYTISYEGNRALAINGTDYFEYDFNGNVTGDAARGMAIGYNLLNLPSWFNDGESDLMVFYDYLADGTKVTLHREDTGMGLAWLGDLVFNMEEQVSEPENPEDGSRGARTSALSKRDTTGKYLKVAKNVNLRGPEEDEEEGAYYSFESTPYAGGRIESIGNGIKVRKFVTDHLGSVRAIVTDNAVVERSDYYPFGGRHDNPSLTTLTTNRYGFTGKERQNISTELDPYIDFGARFYDPLTARWLSPDPLADKYTSLAQYNYCGGDPVNFVDPDGLDIYSFNKKGELIEHTPDDSKRLFRIMNDDASVKAELSIISDIFSLQISKSGKNMILRLSKEPAISLFKLFADNTSVEFGLITTDQDLSIVGTNNSSNSINIVSVAITEIENSKRFVVESIVHSHPGGSNPSGYNRPLQASDKTSAQYFQYSRGYYPVSHYVYSPKTGNLKLYNSYGIFAFGFPFSILY